MARTKCPHCTYTADGSIAGHLSMLAGKLGHPVDGTVSAAFAEAETLTAVFPPVATTKAHVCPVCASVYTSARSLATHRRKHADEKPAEAIVVEAPAVETWDEAGSMPLATFIKAAQPLLLGSGGPVEVIPPSIPTREAWMLAAVEAFAPWFAEQGVTLPAVRVSVGWPGGRGNKQHVVGQCWMASSVADKVPAIFVSPVQQAPGDVLETVLHELIHAAGNGGHRGGFRKLGLALGFMDPMTSSPASPALKEKLAAIAEKLGPFPHSRIIARDTLGSTPRPGAGGATAGEAGEGELLPPPVQGTRMIKASCRDCGYTVRLTRKWITVAVPQCPVHHLDMDVEEKEAA